MFLFNFIYIQLLMNLISWKLIIHVLRRLLPKIQWVWRWNLMIVIHRNEQKFYDRTEILYWWCLNFKRASIRSNYLSHKDRQHSRHRLKIFHDWWHFQNAERLICRESQAMTYSLANSTAFGPIKNFDFYKRLVIKNDPFWIEAWEW